MPDSAKATMSDVIYSAIAQAWKQGRGLNDASEWTEDEEAAYTAEPSFTEGRSAVARIQARKLADKIAADLVEAGFGDVEGTLEEIATSRETLERARKSVEDELVEWRDSMRSVFGRNNGLVIKNYDGSDSKIIRFGFEDGFRIAMMAEIVHRFPSTPK